MTPFYSLTLLYSLVLILGSCFVIAALANHTRRLKSVEQKLNLLLEKFGLDPSAAVAPSLAVRNLARDPARRIEAIREYRRETGADLEQAMKVVDALGAQDR
jgi:hypothetical protein